MKLSKPVTLALEHYSFGDTKPDRKVTVQFREIPHYYTGTNVNDNPWKRYEVMIDGEVVGRVEQVTASTDSQIRGTRLRRVGRGKLAWGWDRPRGKDDPKGFGPVNNSPGMYGSSRIQAVAKMLGYSVAKRVS